MPLTYFQPSQVDSTFNGYLRNRIINGAMMIDQRNAGASVTPNNSYTLDRWLAINSQTGKLTVQRNAGSVTPPAGFSNYLGITSASAYTVLSGDYFSITQFVEGLNIADLNWGSASASTITLSFWVRSSLTGTFGGSVQNSGSSRSYSFTYTILSANTWEKKEVTIPGDTSGTWLTNNNTGIQLNFGLGAGSIYSGAAGAWAGANYISATGATSVVGTNGATLYITGVQLEVGSVATPFERRMYGTELMLCQRYFQTFGGSYAYEQIGYGVCAATTSAYCGVPFQATMRTAPSVGISNSTPNDFTLDYGPNNTRAAGVTTNSITANAGMSASQGRVTVALASGGVTTSAFVALLSYASQPGRLQFSAEL